jgi:cyclopropane fatty-acyl-phospholipid synthase-like methyltransferase
MLSSSRDFPAPFDSVAFDYDETFTYSKIGLAQRRSVRQELAKTFVPGQCVLEIGCGTGVDACFLAEQGVRVFACDSSQRMIQVANRRIRERGLESRIQTMAIAAEDILRVGSERKFDGAFSNFGAMNCVKNLGQFARDLAGLLSPGANFVLCVLGPCCAWEVAYYLCRRKPAKALRRFKRQAIRARVSDNNFIEVNYPSVGQLKRIFAPEFELCGVKGVGVTVPPSYLENWARQHPLLLSLYEKADLLIGRCPVVRLLADHVLVRLKRQTIPES